MAAIKDAIETVRRVMATTTAPGFSPNLTDKTGAKQLAEAWLRREAVFKHQIWKLKLHGDAIIEESERRVNQELLREDQEATIAYERAWIR